MRRLRQLIHVDRRTIAVANVAGRCIHGNAVLGITRARFMPPVDEDRLPAAMLGRFAGNSLTERNIALLRFRAPITGGEMQAFVTVIREA